MEWRKVVWAELPRVFHEIQVCDGPCFLLRKPLPDHEWPYGFMLGHIYTAPEGETLCVRGKDPEKMTPEAIASYEAEWEWARIDGEAYA